MASHSNDNEIAQSLQDTPTNCCRVGAGTALGVASLSRQSLGLCRSNDERTDALIRNGLTVSAIKFLRDETGCDLATAKEMVEHMYGLTQRPLGPPCASMRSTVAHATCQAVCAMRSTSGSVTDPEPGAKADPCFHTPSADSTPYVRTAFGPKADCHERPLLGHHDRSSHLSPNLNFVSSVLYSCKFSATMSRSVQQRRHSAVLVRVSVGFMALPCN